MSRAELLGHIPSLSCRAGSVHVLSGNLPDLIGQEGLAAIFPWPSLTVMWQAPVCPAILPQCPGFTAVCTGRWASSYVVLGYWPRSTHHIGSLFFSLSHSVLDSKRDVSAANFCLHEAHCLRFLTLCSECDEPVARKNMKDHQTEAHKQVRNAPFSCNQRKVLPTLKYSHGTVPSINYIWTSTIVWAENL